MKDLKKGFLAKADLSKEKGDSSKKNQVASDKPKSLNVIQKSADTQIKPIQDKVQQSARNSSSLLQRGLLNKESKNSQRYIRVENQISNSKKEVTKTLEPAVKNKARRCDVERSSDSSKNADILANFEHLAGNTDLANAKVILLAEAHISQHNHDIVDFINAHAKKGDIVLVEGTQTGQEQDKVQEELGKAMDLGYSRDKIMQAIDEKGTRTAYKELVEKGVIRPLMEGLKLYGWDDMEALEKQRKILLGLNKIPSVSEDSRLSELKERYIEKYNELDDKRNEKMLKTIINMKKNFPKKRIFVIVGAKHVEYSIKQENIDIQRYIVLIPKHVPTEKDVEDYERRLIRQIEDQKKQG